MGNSYYVFLPSPSISPRPNQYQSESLLPILHHHHSVHVHIERSNGSKTRLLVVAVHSVGPIVIKTLTVLILPRIVRAMDVLARRTEIVPSAPTQTTIIYEKARYDQPRSMWLRKGFHGNGRAEDARELKRIKLTTYRNQTGDPLMRDKCFQGSSTLYSL